MGVTFTFEEKVGSKLLAIIKASRRLKCSDHLLSISANFSSVLCFDIFVEGDFFFLLFLLSFLGFLSGGGNWSRRFHRSLSVNDPNNRHVRRVDKLVRILGRG